MELIELRKKAGYKTQCDLAIKLGVKQSTIAMWETKRRIPKGQTILVLSKTLNCSTDEILNNYIL